MKGLNMEKGYHGDVLTLRFDHVHEVRLVRDIAKEQLERGNFIRYSGAVSERDEPELVTDLNRTLARMEDGEQIVTEVVGEEAETILAGLTQLAEDSRGSDDRDTARGMIDEASDGELRKGTRNRRAA